MIRAALAVATASVVVTLTPASASASVTGPAWPHRAHSWPVVYVQDATGGGWPWLVRANVRRWGSGLRYGQCRLGAGCICVEADDQGPDGRIVGTEWTYTNPRRPHVATGALIVLNTWAARHRTLAVLVQAAGHELGHALGLGHDPGGVMSAVDYGGAHITHYERRELAGLYGVGR